MSYPIGKRNKLTAGSYSRYSGATSPKSPRSSATFTPFPPYYSNSDCIYYDHLPSHLRKIIMELDFDFPVHKIIHMPFDVIERNLPLLITTYRKLIRSTKI